MARAEAPREIETPAEIEPVFLNRELSWLDFNARVLRSRPTNRCRCSSGPKFLAIFSQNLDEFFQVRVSGLKEQVAAGVRTDLARRARPAPSSSARSARRSTSSSTRQAGRVHQGDRARARGRPASASSTGTSSTTTTASTSRECSTSRIFPVLTPLAVDPAHPFPYISNLSLNLAVVVRDPRPASSASPA